ncbi:uncharacterized protein METZ01_LOCUS210879 [marine metagenome]|uniref:Uncharacterized protein n=1 Tax=marine metagenome TaxID=408172 RepID=A0A382F5Q3_9ZZZZ
MASSLQAFPNLRSDTEDITDLELKSEFSDATWVYLAHPLDDLLHNYCFYISIYYYKEHSSIVQ